MSKTIIAIYQDCFLCGSKKEKGEKMLEELSAAGANFRKLSFATLEGREHCLKAIENGVTKMPFFTDGEIYAADYHDLIKAKTIKVKAKTTAKKTRKSKKEPKDGPISES